MNDVSAALSTILDELHSAQLKVAALEDAQDALVEALLAQVRANTILMERHDFTTQDIIDCTSQSKAALAKAGVQ